VPDQLLTYEQAAMLIDRDPSTIRRWASRGWLIVDRTESPYRVLQSEVLLVERDVDASPRGRGVRRVAAPQKSAHVAASQSREATTRHPASRVDA